MPGHRCRGQRRSLGLLRGVRLNREEQSPAPEVVARCLTLKLSSNMLLPAAEESTDSPQKFDCPPEIASPAQRPCKGAFLFGSGRTHSDDQREPFGPAKRRVGRPSPSALPRFQICPRLSQAGGQNSASCRVSSRGNPVAPISAGYFFARASSVSGLDCV